MSSNSACVEINLKHLPSRQTQRELAAESWELPDHGIDSLSGYRSWLQAAFNCKLLGSRKMATSHGQHSTLVQLAKMKVIYLLAQWAWGRPSCTQCQLNPDAALRQPLNPYPFQFPYSYLPRHVLAPTNV
ncbi:hypothetical protein ACLKA6_002108 [Drosophila palustris]